MAVRYVMLFEGLGQREYEAIARELGHPSPAAGGTTWPDGVISHTASATENGWCVVDVWESQEAFDGPPVVFRLSRRFRAETGENDD